MLHVQDLIQDIINIKVPASRVEVLDPLIEYIKKSQKKSGHTQLNFICTHNSRRSQFSQVWAQIAAQHFGIKTTCYSGGVEITACNERTISSLKRFGLIVSSIGNENPTYEVIYNENSPPVICYSKLVNDKSSPNKEFGAIMTCSHADDNCPIIIGADVRIPVRYEDPKKFDDTKLEEIMYDERSMQIAAEMFYVFKVAKNEQ